MRDPYAVLGLARSASEKEVKAAFRGLAKRYHPDANGHDPAAGARFNEANQAYEILGDAEKRAQYDRGEIDAEGKPKFQGFSGGNPFGGGAERRGPQGFDFRAGGGPDAGDGVFSDFFEQAFGGPGGARRSAGGGFTAARNAASSKGEDIRANLKVRLEDIVSAEKVEAVFPSGKRLAIRLPDGAENGQVIRLRGQGQPSPFPASPAGDALVTIEVLAHPRFEVAGRDLTLDLPVELSTAVLGGKLFVETLDGGIALGIPPWSSSGRTLRIKGRGLTKAGGGRGDILVHLRIVLPPEPDESLAEFLRAHAPASA